MAQNLIGVRQLMIDGEVIDVKAGVDYSFGGDKLESIMGLDRHHGYKVARIPAYLDLTITDRKDFDVKKLTKLRDATVTADLENGKMVKMGHAAYCAEGKVTAAEGEIEARFECDPDDAEEI